MDIDNDDSDSDVIPVTSMTAEFEQRSVKTSSLVLLTHRFVELLRIRKNNMIDLKTASEILNVQKRRIYDITNVLEGVGLLERVAGTPFMRLVGERDGKKNYSKELAKLETANFILKYEEKELDTSINYVQKNLTFILEDPIIKSYSYITRDDLLNAFGDRTLLTVENDKVYLQETATTIRLKTGIGGDIDVRLVTEQGKCNIEDVEVVNSIMEEKEKLKNKRLSFNKRVKRIIDKKPGWRKTGYDRSDDKNETDSNEIEQENTSNLILSKLNYEYSLKQFIPKDLSYVENESPLLKIRKPGEDYRFSLKEGEGLCELFDIKYPS